MVEAAVAFELCGAVDEGVLVAEVLADLQGGGGDGFAGGLLVEDAAAGEFGDGAEGFLAGVEVGAVKGDKGVDGGLLALALFDDILWEGVAAVIEAVVKARPSTAKGAFIENVTLSATMLPGMRIDPTPFLKA